MSIFCCRRKDAPPEPGAFDVPHCDVGGFGIYFPGDYTYSPEVTGSGSALPGYYEFAVLALSEMGNANGDPGVYAGSVPIAGLFHIPAGKRYVSLAVDGWYDEVDPGFIGNQWPTFPRIYTVALFVKVPGDTEFQYVMPSRISETGDGVRITIDLSPPWENVRELPEGFTTQACYSPGGGGPGGV